MSYARNGYWAPQSREGGASAPRVLTSDGGTAARRGAMQDGSTRIRAARVGHASAGSVGNNTSG